MSCKLARAQIKKHAICLLFSINMTLFSLSTLSSMIAAHAKFKKCAWTYTYLICHAYIYSIICLRNHFFQMYRVSLYYSNASIVNCVIICVYGIVYKMTNTLFQTCYLTVAKLPLDENNFELFYCNSLMNIWTSTCIFRSYCTKANALFNHPRWCRRAYVPKFGLRLHHLSDRTDDKCKMSLKFSCNAFYHHNRYSFITRLDSVLL